MRSNTRKVQKPLREAPPREASYDDSQDEQDDSPETASYYDGLDEQQEEFDRQREEHAKRRRYYQEPAILDRSSRVNMAKEIGRDDRHFIAFDNGTVLDLSTNLIWAARDNGSKISWKDAKSYCENYRGGGYGDWRMPTYDELYDLYSPYQEYKSECGLMLHLTKLIQLTGRSPWASEKDLTRRKANIAYSFGTTFYGHRWTPRGDRALPVRTNTERY